MYLDAFIVSHEIYQKQTISTEVRLNVSAALIWQPLRVKLGQCLIGMRPLSSRLTPRADRVRGLRLMIFNRPRVTGYTWYIMTLHGNRIRSGYLSIATVVEKHGRLLRISRPDAIHRNSKPDSG